MESKAIPRGKVATGLGLQAVLFVIAGAAMWRFSGREIADFVDVSWQAAAAGTAFGLALIAAAAATFAAFPRFLEHTARQQARMAMLFPRGADWRMYVFIALCAGIGEEALLRGGLMTILRDNMGLWPAIVLSSLAFAALHVAKPLIGAILVLIGLVFGVVYAWTGSLLTVMIGHAVYDVWALWLLHRELRRLGYLDADPDVAAADGA